MLSSWRYTCVLNSFRKTPGKPSFKFGGAPQTVQVKTARTAAQDLWRIVLTRGLTAVSWLLLSGPPSPLLAQSAPTLPQAGAFTAGAGTIGSASAGSLTITQNSARGVIDWKSFSIGAASRVLLENGAGATLNRVTGGELSRIDGMLKATGSVYLINPNGVVVGANGCVLTNGSFVASTRDISSDAFMAGGPVTASGNSKGNIVNRGAILAREGDVVLIGQSVKNAGSIRAPKGTATLATGNNILLTTIGGPAGVYVAPDTGASGTLTESGRVQAASVALKAAGGDIYTLAGNRSGLISATGTKTVNGEVWLSAPNGKVVASGEISARNADGTGGQVVANGAAVTVAGGARLSAKGSSGGKVLVGVSSPGGADLAGSTTIANGASIQAGGPAGGGLVETSGHAVSIGRAAIGAGRGGLWSVDPIDLTIDAPAAFTIASSLNTGTNVSEQTTASTASGAGVQSAGAGDITVAAPITWTGSGGLTLSAYHDLKLNAAISGGGSFTGTAGNGIAVNSNVSALNITLQTTGAFTNNAGASALNAGAGHWLVYSANPSADNTGGLAPDFLQYAANPGATPAAVGNGLLYSVTPSLSVSLSGTVSKTYDGTTAAVFSGANATVTGLINSDSAAVTGVYASKDAGSGINVAASNIAVNHGGIPVYGYTGTAPSVSAAIGEIDPATLTASVVGDPTKTYNATTTATLTSSNYQISGVVAGETLTVNQPSSVAYDSPDAGSRTVNATFSPTNFVAGSGTSLSNYVLPTNASGAGHIAQAPLLITGVLATDKVYDRSTADTLNTASAALYGVIGSDNVSLVTGGAAGTFLSVNAGSNLPVTASGFILSGTKAGNYAVVQPTGLTANINPASLTASGLAAFGKIYDGTTSAALDTSSATLNGVIAGDTVTLNTGSANGIFAGSDIGTAIPVATAGLALSGPAAANYSLTLPTGLSADITPRPLSVAIVSTPTKTYNGDAGAVIDSSAFSLTGFVAGQSATVGQLSQAAYDTPNAGSQNVTATLGVSDYVAGSGTRLSNYLLPSTVVGTGLINPAPITISLVGNPSKTFDTSASALLDSSNYRVSGFLAGQNAGITQTAGLYDSPNAGLRQVTATLTGADFTPDPGTLLSNYSFPSTVTGFGTIFPAPLAGSISAEITGNPTKLYDGNTVAHLTSSDFTLHGFMGGDGATVTQTTGQYASKDVGVQAVTANLAPSDLVADGGTILSNYTLPTAAFGSGTINPAPLTASIVGTPTKVYNGTTLATLSSANYSISGLAPGEGVTISSAAPAAYDSRQAGARSITAAFATTDIAAQPGTLLSNYVLPAGAAGPGAITQAPLSVLGIGVEDKTYDTTAAATLTNGGAHLFGVVGSDNVSLSTGASSAVFASANAGSGVAVNASGYAISGIDAANYQLFQPVGLSATISRAALTILGVSATDKVYDNTAAAALDTSSAALFGILAADTSLVNLNTAGSSAAFSSVNVGNGLAVNTGGFALTGAQASNYSLSQPAGLTANITPRPLTALIVGNPTKVYDGSPSTTLTASNYQMLGFVAGQSATVPQSASANYLSANAGSQGIQSTLASSDFVAGAGTNLSNYILPATGSGTGTITRAPLTASIIGNPTKIYDTNTNATLTSSNYSLSGFVSGQGATVGQTFGAYSSPNAGSRTVTAILAGGDFTPAGVTDLNNYILPVSATGFGTIDKAQLQVVNVLATSRTYNGTTADTLNTSLADLSGLLGSDTVALNSGSATGVFASKDAGTNIAVTAAGFTISGAQSANYDLAQPIGLLAEITQASLNLTKVKRIYDSTTGLPASSSAYTLSGLFGSDAVSVDTAGLAGNFGDKNVGTGKNVSLTGLALAGAQSANYTIASSVTNANIGEITKAPLTVANAHAFDKMYDATTAATLDNSSAVLSGLLGSDAVTLDSSAATGAFLDKNAGPGKTVVASGYTVSGIDFSNYDFTQPTGLLATINPFTGLTLASVAKTYDGGLGLPASSSAYVLNGLKGADNVQVATGAGLTGSYGSANVGTGLSISLSGLTLTGVDAGNYSIGSSLSNANIGIINAKSLTASIVNDPTKTYDATTNATLGAANYNLSGFVTGDSAAVTKTTGTYASSDAGSRAVSTSLAGGDFTANGGTLLSNYILPVSASGTGTIDPAQLTITGVFATPKTYNGNTVDPLSTASAALSGVVAADAGLVALNTTGATGTFASPNVGNVISVAASGFVIGGSKSANYTLAQPTGLSADIVQAILSLVSVDKVYDATNAASGVGVSYTLAGIVGSDSVSLDTAGLAGTYFGKNVGAGLDVSLTGLGLTGSQAANYSIASSVTNAAIGNITPASLSVTGAQAVDKVYNGTAAAAIDNTHAALTGVLGSDVVNLSSPTAGTFSSANAGTWTVAPSGSYTVSGVDAANYIVTQPSGFSATISRAPLSASITGSPTKTYDGNSVAALASGNYALTGFVSGEGAAVNHTVGAFDSSNAGARTVTASLGGADFTPDLGTLLSNYILPSAASGVGTIDPKALTAAILGNPTKTYDGTIAAALASGDYSLSGFISGQGATVSGSTSADYDSADAGSRTVTAALHAGDFTANGGTNLANYILPSAASGVGTIDPKALTAAITGNPSRAYDGTTGAALNAGDFTLAGFVSGQGASVTQTAGAYGGPDAGSHAVTTTLAAGDFAANGGTNLANYVLPTTASGAGTIDPKMLTAFITGNLTKTYDGTTNVTLAASDYALDGFIAGQGAAVAQTLGAYDSANAGSRAVTAALSAGDIVANGGTNLANYALPSVASGSGTINPKALIAAITGTPAKAYDGTETATLESTDYTIAGFLSGQGATITQTAGTYAGSDAGYISVQAMLTSNDFAAAPGTLLSNYLLPASVMGVGRIDPKALTASIVDASKTYDGSTGAVLGLGNFALSGFAPGQGAIVFQIAGAYAAPDAGSRVVTAALSSGDFTLTGGANPANYILPTSASGIGVIRPRPLLAAITGTPAKTYDGTAVATLASGDYLLTGFLAGQGATVTQTIGIYDAADAGPRALAATLAGSDFVAAAGTNLNNYVLPSAAVGVGSINPRPLSAAIVGVPTKMNDGTILATLTSANFALSGFVAGQGAAVTQTIGSYDSAETGSRAVTSSLNASYFTPAAGTLLSNYILPLSATGEGMITPAILINAPTLGDAITANLAVRNLASGSDAAAAASQAIFGAAVPRSYIPFPAPSALSSWQNNGFGSLPAIVGGNGAFAQQTTTEDGSISSSAPLINTTEQILLQGGRSKSWRIVPPSGSPLTSQESAQ